jgi:hypothetical protein
MYAEALLKVRAEFDLLIAELSALEGSEGVHPEFEVVASNEDGAAETQRILNDPRPAKIRAAALAEFDSQLWAAVREGFHQTPFLSVTDWAAQNRYLTSKRVSTYGTDFKILRFSKPTVEGTSRINRHFLRGSRAFYHIARPSCGEFQELGWALLRFGRVLPRRDDAGEARFAIAPRELSTGR